MDFKGVKHDQSQGRSFGTDTLWSRSLTLTPDVEDKIGEYYAKKKQEKELQQENEKKRKLGQLTSDEDAFLVPKAPMGGKEEVHNQYEDLRSMKDWSMFIFAPSNKFRLICNDIISNVWFDKFVLLNIFANCVILALIDPTGTTSQRFVRNADIYFAVIFTAELLVRFVAKGIILRAVSPSVLYVFGEPVLRNGWNWIDLVVVITAWPPLFTDVGGATLFRAFRVLRPLRILAVVPFMRTSFVKLFSSVPLLMDVALQVVFLLTLFSIMAMMLFSGKFHQNCTNGAEPFTDEDNPDPILCGFVRCTSVVPDAQPPLTCAVQGDTGEFFPAPENNLLQFDNFFFSILTTFVCSTLEGWTDVMYIAMDVTNPGALVFFVVLVFVMSFLVLNLALAVIADTFQSAPDDDVARRRVRDPTRDLQKRTAGEEAEIFFRKIYMSVTERMEWFTPFQVFARKIALNPIFELFITIAVVLNVLALLCIYYPANAAVVTLLTTLNLIFTIIFGLELALKLSALGLIEYLSEPFNILDAIVTIASITQIFVGAGSVSVFRILRLMQIIKLVKALKSLQLVVMKVVSSFFAVVKFLPVLLLFMYIFTILGSQFYGPYYVTTESTPDFPVVGSVCTSSAKSDTGCPRANWSTFGNSFLVVFQVLTGENWNSTMYDAMFYTGWWSAFFYVAMFWILSFVLLNVFLTIMLIRFAEPDDEFEADAARDKGGELTLREAWRNLRKGTSRFFQRIFKMASLEESTDSLFFNNDLADTASYHTARDSFGTESEFTLYPSELRESAREEQLQAKEGTSQDRDISIDVAKSFFIFARKNPVRRFCTWIVEKEWFSNGVLVSIVLSSISLALYTPQWPQDSPMRTALRILDLIWYSVFTIETVLKAISMGFVLGPGCYLRNAWDIVDFIIVCSGWLSLVPALAWLRALRAMRPIRLVRKLPGLRVVFLSLIKSTPTCGNVLLVALFVWLLFSVIGVNFFAGTFYSCQCDFVPYGTDTPVIGDPITRFVVEPPTVVRQSFGSTCTPEFIEELQQAQNSRALCEANGGTWVPFPANFDNSLIAMLTLFEIVTLENWLDIMYAAMDARGIDKEPKEDNNEAASLFFVFFIFIGSFFVLNLFVSVLAESFSAIKREHEYGGSALLTRDQFEWLEGQRMVLRMRVTKQHKPPRRDSRLAPLRFFCYKLATSVVFDAFITACIILSAIVMAAEYWNMSEMWVQVQLISGFLFTIIFFFEASIKICGLGPKQYFRDLWNIFDFTIVVLTLVPVILEVYALVNPDEQVFNASFIIIFRMLRLLRLLRLANRLRNIQMLFQTLLISLPSILNVGMLLFLIFFVYSTLGVLFFGQIGILTYPPPNGGGISKYANFWNAGWALLTMLRCSTGEAWNSIMWDIMVQGGGFGWAWVFFVTFIVIGSFVVLNLFIAIVLEAFATVMEHDKFTVRETDFAAFQSAWAIFDPNGDKTIDVGRDLKPLLREIPPPLGVGRHSSVTKVLRLIDELKLPDGTSLRLMKSGRVGFHELLSALVNHAYQVDINNLPSGLQKEVRTTSRRVNTAVGDEDQASRDVRQLEKEEEARLYLASTTLQVIARQYLDTFPEESDNSFGDIQRTEFNSSPEDEVTPD